MPVIGGNNPTVQVTVPVPAPAPMKKRPQPKPQPAPQPVPTNPESQQQPTPQGLDPAAMQVPQQPEPRAIIMPWAPEQHSRSIRRMRVRYAKSSPWYSHALRVIEEKVPNRASADQIRRTLLNNGVKPDEMKWGGIDSFLGWNPFTISTETQGPANFINKAELLDHVKRSVLKFTEKTYGTVKPRLESEQDAASQAEDRAKQAFADVSQRLLTVQDRKRKVQRAIDQATPRDEPFHQIRLVGNNGFRNRPATRFDVVRYVPRDVRGRLVWTKDRTLASGTPRELHNRGYEDQSYGGIHNQILTSDDLQDKMEYEERQQQARDPEVQRQLEQHRQEMTKLDEEHRQVLAEHQTAKKAVDAATKKRIGAAKPKGTPTRYGPDSQYQGKLNIPGGTNYRETTVHLPESAVRDAEIGRAQDGGGVGREFKSGHFPGKNILYHVRYNDFTTPDGRKLLHLDEIQSDLTHESGYDHPYKKNWHELALRKMLHHAAANGYDGISWTPGRVQADRYNLGKIVDQIQYRFGQHNPGETPATVIIRPRHSGTGKLFEEIKTSPQELHQYVGREHASRIMNDEGDPSQTFTSGFGNEWKVLPVDETHMGGESHKRLYDQMIPRYLSKIGEKHGAELKTEQVPDGKGGGQEVQSMTITPKLRQAVTGEGQALYSRLRKLRLRMAKRKLPRRTLRMAKRYARGEYAEALVKSVKANQHDSTPRGMLADYLEENHGHVYTPKELQLIRTTPHLNMEYIADNPQRPVHFSKLTMADIRAANQAAGHHWFDRGNNRMFGTKYHGSALHGPGGVFFITSEPTDPGRERLWPGSPRRFSIRRFDPESGDVRTVGDFRGHGFYDDAKQEAVARANGTHQEPQQMSRSKKYAADDDDLSMDFDSMGEDQLPKAPHQRPAPKEDITGRTRKQILQQMLDAARKGHFDPSGMTPRDYIQEMENKEDVPQFGGDVFISDPEDEEDQPKSYNRVVTYPRTS